MADEDPPECRVCRDDTGPLIAPCACTGTIKYCHLECLLQWLSHSTTERLRTKPRCGVCQQPFKLRARPAYVYVYHRLSNISAIRKAVPALCEHVLQEPGPHLHCMCARGLIIFGVLQLCLWQAQLLMLLAYGSLCALLLLDAMLDELLVPAAILPTLHAALPPVCEVRRRTLSLANIEPQPRRFTRLPKRRKLGKRSAGRRLASAAATATRGFVSRLGHMMRAALPFASPPPPPPPAAVEAPTATPSMLSLLMGAVSSAFPNATSLATAFEGSVRLVSTVQLRRCYPDAAAEARLRCRGDEACLAAASAAAAAAAANSAAAAAASTAVLPSTAAGAAALASFATNQSHPAWAARAMDSRFYASAYASTRAYYGAPDDAPFAWRLLLPLDSDVFVLSTAMLLLNLLVASHVLSAYFPERLEPLKRALRRFVVFLEPTELDTPAFEDCVHYLLQLGCAAYAGRVTLARTGFLAQDEYPLDFGSGSGLALHVAVGLLTWGAWSGISEALQAAQDDFAKWRWSVDGVRLST